MDVASHAIGIQFAQPPAQRQRVIPGAGFHQNKKTHLEHRLDLAILRAQGVQLRQGVHRHIEFDIALGCKQSPVE